MSFTVIYTIKTAISLLAGMGSSVLKTKAEKKPLYFLIR